MTGAIVQVSGLVTVYVLNSGAATVADVRRWLDEVSALGIDESTVLESANLKVTLKAHHLERDTSGNLSLVTVKKTNQSDK